MHSTIQVTCRKCVTPAILSRLAESGVDLDKTTRRRSQSGFETDPFDVLIVDGHSWKSSRDIVGLCRERHPEAKIVMFDDMTFYKRRKRASMMLATH